jgi:hypothetical protein
VHEELAGRILLVGVNTLVRSYETHARLVHREDGIEELRIDSYELVQFQNQNHVELPQPRSKLIEYWPLFHRTRLSLCSATRQNPMQLA